MAGGGEAEDNPVHMNVVAMVDIIFCLCVFFMCSFKFKQLEGNFKSWLPTDKGVGGVTDPGQLTETRIALFWDEENSRVIRQYGYRQIDDDAELERIIEQSHEDYVKAGKLNAPVIIDAEYKVPWQAVMTVVNMVKRLDIQNLEFAMGAGGPPK